MKKDPQQYLPEITHALEAWFHRQGKSYPWRDTTDPYAILVSEMMLQQTQISTVLDRGYYARWMTRFPDLATLSQASEADVLRTWEGLGYYRRSRFLHQMAQKVMAEHGGQFPQDAKGVRSLPGVGDYTAGAVCSFAYDHREAIVDGNVARVLARLWNDATPVDSTEGLARLWERSRLLVAECASPRVFNSALMELGQTVCRVTSPLCDQCPVQTWCLAENPSELPVKGKRTEITEVTERVYYHRSAQGVLLQQESGKRRTGLWKLPELAVAEGTPLPRVIHKAKYIITRYKVTLWVHGAPQGVDPVALAKGHEFVPVSALEDLPMPSPYRKALNAVLAQDEDTASFRLT